MSVCLIAWHHSHSPACRSKVHGTFENIESLVDLQKLESAARTPALFFGFAIEDVALVLRHWALDERKQLFYPSSEVWMPRITCKRMPSRWQFFSAGKQVLAMTSFSWMAGCWQSYLLSFMRAAGTC